PCGLNGALHFTQMDADSGVAKSNESNRAGVKYGTGYCDAQCPKDINFINGIANLHGWAPISPLLGTCCPEMDVW
ncbi:glycoside hydrolase, partial [Mycena albidolilacea]